MPLKKILVAVDGSAPSVRAAEAAVTVARATWGTVTLVCAVPPELAPIEAYSPDARWLEEGQRQAQALLDAQARALAPFPVATLLLHGSAAEVIAREAEAHHFDLVVVGSHGRNAAARLLLGSTTDRLVHICHAPVLVVR